MLQTKTKGLFSLLLLVILIGCEDSKSNIKDRNDDGPTFISECAGFLSVKINFLTPAPSNVKIIWQGRVIADGCKDQPQGSLVVKKEGNSLIISDGGFGYTAQQVLSVQIFEQSTCDSETEIFALDDYKVSAVQPELCESFSAEFDE